MVDFLWSYRRLGVYLLIIVAAIGGVMAIRSADADEWQPFQAVNDQFAAALSMEGEADNLPDTASSAPGNPPVEPPGNAEAKLPGQQEKVSQPAQPEEPLPTEQADLNRAIETVSSQPKENQPASLLININSASVSQLTELTGIGPSKASAIVEYRLENGGFTKIEDIMNVKGIGVKTFEKFKDKITVGKDT